MLNHEASQPLDLLERSQAFQESLMDIDSLDGLINLACTVLDCSLYVCDGQGFVLASSQPDERSCPSFARSVGNKQVNRKNLKTMLGPKPLCNVMRDPGCPGEPCTRFSFPLKIGEQGLPGAVTFFFWDRPLTTDDQALASMVAGAFSVWMRKRFSVVGSARARKISLLRELLEYKPGLRSYYERGLAMENLHALPGAFRVACVQLGEAQRPKADTLAMEIQYQLEDAWVFPHKDWMLAVFNESAASAEEICAALAPTLEQLGAYACMSTAFDSLLKLRHAVGDTQVACRIAARKAPQERMQRAERWLDLVFLSKCQQYFPLEDYYLEGFRRLHDYDEANGSDYLGTLTAYLDNSMNVSAAAKAIFMHRNTMSQQLEKIEEILGVPLKEQEMGWYLQLCLRIHELLEL